MQAEVEPLPPPVSGEPRHLAGPVGDMALYAEGRGSALLLIHSINAAGSAAEIRPLHEHYRTSRRVYSLDLPGFGLSDRPDCPYSPRIMTDAVLRAVRAIREELGPVPVDALALSLSCEYLARAAMEAPTEFRSLALVSPTGFQKNTVRRAPAGADRGVAWLYWALTAPGWGGAIYRQLTRPAVIRYFLRRTWGSDAIDEELWRYDILTARQPNAACAPLRFLSGYLFSGDIHTVYEALSLPVWMSHGIRGDFTDYGGQGLVADRPNWQFTTFPTGALPHFEIPDAFFTEYDRFLEGVSRGGS